MCVCACMHCVCFYMCVCLISLFTKLGGNRSYSNKISFLDSYLSHTKFPGATNTEVALQVVHNYTFGLLVQYSGQEQSPGAS